MADPPVGLVAHAMGLSDEVRSLERYLGPHLEGETTSYVATTDRHGQHRVFQFSRWVYAGTRSRGKVFTAFGRIQGDYLVGRWYDNRDEAGYFGVFQLRLIDRNRLEGTWMGHSKAVPGLIRTGPWKWERLPG